MRKNVRRYGEAFSLVVWYWVPLVTYAGAIVYLSSLSTPEEHIANLANGVLVVSPDSFTQINDKVYHLAEYGLLSVLIYRTLWVTWRTKLGDYLKVMAILVATGYGCLDELHQWFVPLRHVQAWDVMLDSLGAILGVFCWERITTLPLSRSINQHWLWRIPLTRSMTASKF